MFTEIDTSACVLFLGSGFSADGKNILRKAPPVGDGLRKDLIQLLNDASYQEHDLQVVSEAAAADPGIDLCQELYNRYTITEIPTQHTELLKLRWRRIYTTNYDDAVELACPERRSFSYDQPVPRRLPEGPVIHLHGAIRSANPDNVLQQLILAERSYVRQHLEKSPWLIEFDRDVRFADSTFFLGYSLRDQHIAALLMRNPSTVQKVFFVTKDPPDNPTTTRFQQYGHILPIGIPQFANLIQTLPKPARPSAPNQLKSLRYLDPLQDKAAIAPPTSTEVRHLLAFGAFNFKRMIAGLADEEYVVKRDQLVERAARSFGATRTLIIDARLGNGKTIFLYLLGAALSEIGYKCFFCRANAVSVTGDLDALRAIGRVAIFFDSYGTALNLIQEFSGLSEAVFAVAVRTSVRAVQMHEILSWFPSPVDIISLNSLQRAEREGFSKLANKAGLLSGTFGRKVETARDFRELVLTIFDNAQIRASI